MSFSYVHSMAAILNLSIASFNVNGLRDSKKCSKITQWAKIFNFDIILLQELFLSSADDFQMFKRQWGGPVVFSPSRSNLLGGVAISFKNNLKCTTSQVRHDNNGRCISVLCDMQTCTFRVCNTYAPNAVKERKEFFRNLYVLTRVPNPIITGGDFNCIMSNIVGSITHLLTVGHLPVKVVDCYRTDHPTYPGRAWFRCSKYKSSRIDHIYFPNNLDISKASALTLPYPHHNLVLVDIKIPRTADRGKGYFKYNVSLNNYKDFCKDLHTHFKLWATQKPGFYSLSEW